MRAKKPRTIAILSTITILIAAACAASWSH